MFLFTNNLLDELDPIESLCNLDATLRSAFLLMKNLTKGLTTSLCVFSLASIPCFGQEEKDKGFYTTVGAGTMYIDSIIYSDTAYGVDTGFSLETGLGYRFNPNIRFEITYGRNSFTVENSSLLKDVASNSIFFNGYYDIVTNSKMTPYIGGGLGTVTVDTDATTDADDSATTLQAKLGLTYDASEKVDVFGEVGYQSIGKFNVGNTDFEDTPMIRAQLGLRYFF